VAEVAERLDGGCAVGRCSGRWAGLVGEHSAEEVVASSRRIAVAVVEEVASIRRIVVAVEGRHSFHTEAGEVHSSSRHILAEVGDTAEVGILHTAAVVGEALGRSLPGYGSLDRGSQTCLRNEVDFERATS